jgi:bla regulator protein blaR1
MNVDACLAVYGLVVALVAPKLLSRQSVIARVPRFGVVVWLLAAISVLGSWFIAAASLANHASELPRLIGSTLLVSLALRLMWVSAGTWLRTRAQRARYADAAVLLGRPDAKIGALVVPSPELAVYCLPRSGGGLIVVTTGARSALSPRQLEAALSHERAHLAGHHHIVLAIGEALSRAVPRLQLYRQLPRETARLLEMCADDAAARTHGRMTVAAAIGAMRRHTAPRVAMAAGGSTAMARARRLVDVTPTSVWSRVALCATAVVLTAGPYLATLPPCPHPW